MDVTAALASAKYLIRLTLLCLVAGIAATLLARQGILQRVESALSDHVTYSRSIDPANATILVATDEETIRKTGKFPYDRATLARALSQLEALGVRRVYLDASLNYPEDVVADDALEAALARLGPARLALPQSRLAGNAVTRELTTPLERFARHATPVALDILYDQDRRARQVAGMKSHDLPLAVDWLAGKGSDVRTDPLRVNLAVDAGRLKRVNLLDVAEGRVLAKDIRGRDAILGLQVAATQYQIATPRYRFLSRLDFLALAAETIQQDIPVRPLPQWGDYALAFSVAFLLAQVISRIGALPAFSVCILTFAAWLTYADRLQQIAGYTLPMLAPPLAVLIVAQTLKFRDSALSRWFGRLWVRFAGIGKNSLVAALDVMSDPALIYDAKGTVLDMNEAFHSLRGRWPGSAVTRTSRITDLFPGSAEQFLTAAAAGHTRRLDLTQAQADGETRHYEVGVRWIETVSGRLAIASLKDITEERDRETSLARLAFKDALTGLANRTSLSARLARFGEEAKPLAVLMIDLDGFKQVNDSLGHHAGDLLLQGVARRIETLLRPQDLAARLGGDEFAILLATSDEAVAAMVAERLLRALREPFDIEGAAARVGASIGIALGPTHHSDPLEVLKLADTAMYVAKKVKPAYAVHQPDGAAAVRKLAA